MKSISFPIKSLIIVLYLTVFLAACSGNSSSTATTSTTTTSSGNVTITGSAKTTTSGKPSINGSLPHYVALPSATVTMSKVTPDGTKTAVNIGTVTTDSSGNFTIPNVVVPTTGTGASTDYFYEIKVTDGTNTVTYPVAPTADISITMSPASTLADNILASVVDNPNSASVPTPAATVINNAVALVGQNMTDLSGKTTLPNSTDTSDKILAAANGVASAGGNAEAEYRALQFGSEYAGFKANLATATDDDVAGYLMRISKESCGTANNPVTILDTQALATALKAGLQYTANGILTAYNSVATQQAAASKITDYGSAISGFDGSTAITDLQLIAYLARRNLTTVNSTTNLDPDQAMSFLIFLGSASGNLCTTNALNFARMVASLTSSSLMTSPKIMNYEIYNSMYGGCTGSNVSFSADDVQVFIPKNSTITGVTGVTVSAAGFNSNLPYQLTLDNDRYRTTGTSPVVCVAQDTSLTYTITATLTDNSTLTQAVTRQHNKVPEPTVFTINGVQLTNVDTSPVISVDTRPLFAWTAPATLQATMTGAGAPPAGSTVKYTYEFAHYKVGSGGPINPPTTACPGANTGGARKLYTVNHFIPAADCNPTACKTAQVTAGTATNSDTFECRIYINAWLVDKNDKLLGQAAGSFGYFKP